ncbi:MAG TPA: M20/M25/M40 family metallo-hydrolase [Thermoanaerobaculia bacterium]|nr:M20/M25/M40 family metallo-hydrolase [Thermoanaerobaculia bacterium]
MARVIDPRRHRNERIAAAVVVVVLAAIATVAVRWNLFEQRELRSDQRYIPRPVTITPDVTALQELVRIDSSKPEGVARAARWIAAYLENNGVRAELIESAPSMLNVYARIKGRRPGHALLLFNHIDVVPAGDGWSSDPFAATIGGDRMWGRGTLDMKALTICQLVAFVDIAKSGRAPEHDLVFLATAEEERGSREGMQWLLAHRPDLFDGVAYGITEGGITELIGDRLTYFGVEIGGKQLVQAIVSAPSRESLRAARIALEPAMFPRQPERVVPAVRAYFQQAAPTRLQFRDALADIDKTIREGHFWKLPPTYRDLVQNSVATGGPQDRNGRMEMLVTMINLPDEDPAARLAWLSKTIAPTGAVVRDVPVREGPVPTSPGNTRLFALLTAEASKRYGVPAGAQVLFRSATDSRFLRRRGIVCYGISPYLVNFAQSVSIHSADESITVPAFQEGIEFTRSVVRAWAAE